MWDGAVARGRRAMLARFAALWIPPGAAKRRIRRTKPPFGIGPDGGFDGNIGNAARQSDWIYFWAVTLVSMFTTCTRRLASASGWLGSFSLLLP